MSERAGESFGARARERFWFQSVATWMEPVRAIVGGSKKVGRFRSLPLTLSRYSVASEKETENSNCVCVCSSKLFLSQNDAELGGGIDFLSSIY